VGIQASLAITATKAGGNVATIAPDAANPGYIKVSLNGQSEDFLANKVVTINYTGGMSGGDTFINNTNISDGVVAHGGHNTITGSEAISQTWLFGNDNTYNAPAGSKKLCV
jgi:hypothetical protein